MSGDDIHSKEDPREPGSTRYRCSVGVEQLNHQIVDAHVHQTCEHGEDSNQVDEVAASVLILQRSRLPDEGHRVVIKMPTVNVNEGRKDHANPLFLKDDPLETDATLINGRPVEIGT